jgi:anti-sigma B factor antagonist
MDVPDADTQVPISRRLREDDMADVGTVSMQGHGGPGAPVVQLHGDIDLASVDLLEDCLATGVDCGGDVFVDLADVTLIDGASLSVLVRAGRVAERRGQTIHLVAPSPFVQRILAAAELRDVFPVVPTRVPASCRTPAVV